MKYVATWVIGALLLLSGCATPEGTVKVRGGSFYMGTDRVDDAMEAQNLGLPEAWYVDEHPFHEVNLATFFIDRTEVSTGRYQAFIDAHPKARSPDDWAHRRRPQGRADYPVTYVSWYDAQHYCHWRGARLPTEAEWEKAARGPKARIYPWGNRFDAQRANVSSGPFDRGRPRPVGSLIQGQSPYGVLDLIGNVWEWVDADYRPYPNTTEEVDAFSQKFKVMRGLSFEAVGHYPKKDYARVVAISARSSFRGYDHPTSRLRDVGFRCVVDRFRGHRDPNAPAPPLPAPEPVTP